jgi:polyketide synthase PksN
MAQDINEFWKNLLEGKDCIAEVPKDRWDWEEFYGILPLKTIKQILNGEDLLKGLMNLTLCFSEFP